MLREAHVGADSGQGAWMEFQFSAEADALRGRLREMVTRELPADFLGAFTNDPADLATTQRFCRLLAEDGLLTLAWPKEFGGLGGSVWEQTVVREEMWAVNEPRGAQYMGVNWVGPVIMRHGTPEQQRQHLRAIAAGEVIWCQGFSEPDAGSDLSSLRTAARRDDAGRWVINGQKVWTSYAKMAQWCFLLARTGTEGTKHDQITVFLVPMDTPGIDIRPISSMVGPHHLNEVFFDNVQVDDDAVLGTAGGGWPIVREVLAFERVGIARYARCERLLQWAPEALGPAWSRTPLTLRTRWARALVQSRAVRLLAYRVLADQASGNADPAAAASYRVAATTLDQSVADVLLDLAGTGVIGTIKPDVTASAEDRVHYRFLRGVEEHWHYAQAASVASGSVEMQRNLIGRTLAKHG
jgi:alkylation response protein AidB-like acyl-CoA dehydrogenase